MDGDFFNEVSILLLVIIDVFLFRACIGIEIKSLLNVTWSTLYARIVSLFLFNRECYKIISLIAIEKALFNNKT